MADQSTELFDAIYNGDLCAIIFSDAKGYTTQANARCCRMLGYEEQELLGRRVIELVPDEDEPALTACIQELLAGTKTSVNIKHRFFRKNGDICWITGSLSRFVNTEGGLSLESAFIDVTLEVEAEEELRKSRDTIRTIINTSDVQYYTYYPNRHHLDISLLNEHYDHLETSWDGYPDSFIESMKLSPEDAETFRETVRAIDGGAREASCVTRMQYEGMWLWMDCRFASVFDEEGKVIRAEGYATNVTDRKNAERRRDQVMDIMNSMASKYDSFYMGDVETDTFSSIEQSDARIDDVGIPEGGSLTATLEEFAERGIAPEYRNLFLSYTLPEQVDVELSGGVDSFEFQYRESKALKSRWKLGEIISVNRDQDGKVLQYCLAVTDITELKHREFERMRKSEAQAAMLEIALGVAGIFDFTYHVQERAIICSDRIQKALHCKERYDDMPNEFREAFIHPDYYDAFNEMYERCNNGEDEASAEFKDKSGTHWYRTTLYLLERDAEGKSTLALGLVERADELHAAKSEAATLQQLCQFAVESHYEDLLLIDAKESTYSFVDLGGGLEGIKNGLRTAGNYDESIAGPLIDLAETEEDKENVRGLVLDALLPTLKSDGKKTVRYRMKMPDGGIRWMQIECVFFNNDFDRILMLVSDVQKEESDKEALREAREEADEANRAKSAFLANMSHEIRTPMNTIIGISEILLNKQLPLETLNEISSIQNAASGLLAIINDILDFSKIESGKFVINPVDYMLPSLLMDINNMISVRLVDKPIDFLINLDHKLPNHLLGDDIRIEQILMNLLGNSVKFTKEGFIELRIDGEAVDEGNYRLTFKIIDSGIGIKEEDIDKLFGSFTQVDTTKNRSITGSGLGLAISRSFAEMMGGGISVESVYGKGTTFTVEIMQQVKFYEPIGEVKNRTAKMLICDNNEVVISSISRTLENLGVEFRVCRDFDKVRAYEGMTHVLVRSANFAPLKEKLDFMFEPSNVYLILDNGEQMVRNLMDYKQLQLPLLCLQLINALNGETIANSYKRKNFDRSQIIPLSYAHVLIVDDNVTNLQVARGLMAPYQMQIDVATSGFKAIELAKSVRYDIIFMDHMMPEMDGLEATKHIRELPGDYYRTLPIVALTANAVSDARELFLENGMDDFLAKPIEMTELHRILKQYVQSKAPAGYMEEYLAQNADQKKSVEKTGSTVSAAKPFTVAAGAVKLAGTVDGGAFGQLLAQNNALLSQNMLLLQGLLGSADSAAPEHSTPSIQIEPSMPVTENDTSGDDEACEVLPGSIPEVNMTKALETYGGSIKIYHGILDTYYRDLSEREPSLREFYVQGDLENLTISVHAIKSASREVGADALGELAYQMEMAGRDGDKEFIEEHFDTFIDEVDKMRDDVGAYVEAHIDSSDGAPERDSLESFPRQIVEELKDACENMDYSLAEEKLEELDEHRYPEAPASTLAAMIRYCAEFEYDKLDRLVKTL